MPRHAKFLVKGRNPYKCYWFSRRARHLPLCVPDSSDVLGPARASFHDVLAVPCIVVELTQYGSLSPNQRRNRPNWDLEYLLDYLKDWSAQSDACDPESVLQKVRIHIGDTITCIWTVPSAVRWRIGFHLGVFTLLPRRHHVLRYAWRAVRPQKWMYPGGCERRGFDVRWIHEQRGVRQRVFSTSSHSFALWAKPIHRHK